MNINTEKVRFSKNQQQAFDFLSDMENYRQLMPNDTKSFDIHESGNGFSVQIGALPKVGMRLKEKIRRLKSFLNPLHRILNIISPSISTRWMIQIQKLGLNSTEDSI